MSEVFGERWTGLVVIARKAQVLPRGSHVARGGMVHVVRMSNVGVKADGSEDLYGYWTECQHDGDATHVPFGEVVETVPGPASCIGCIAEGYHDAQAADGG